MAAIGSFIISVIAFLIGVIIFILILELFVVLLEVSITLFFILPATILIAIFSGFAEVILYLWKNVSKLFTNSKKSRN